MYTLASGALGRQLTTTASIAELQSLLQELSFRLCYSGTEFLCCPCSLRLLILRISSRGLSWDGSLQPCFSACSSSSSQSHMCGDGGKRPLRRISRFVRKGMLDDGIWRTKPSFLFFLFITPLPMYSSPQWVSPCLSCQRYFYLFPMPRWGLHWTFLYRKWGHF